MNIEQLYSMRPGELAKHAESKQQRPNPDVSQGTPAMTPEDKELLVRAARAARYKLIWADDGSMCWLAESYDGRQNTDDPWNPLADDGGGDAFSLAVHLNIEIIFHREERTVQAVAPDPKMLTVGWTFTEEWGEDKGAATQRAIVTAAAAMWLDHVDEMDKGEIAPAAIAGGGWSALKMVATDGDGKLADVPREG